LPLSFQRVSVSVRYGRKQTAKRPIGYARVSTYGQALDAQLEQLRGAVCTEVTGARADRREHSQNA
jgi:hypothetical protein